MLPAGGYTRFRIEFAPSVAGDGLCGPGVLAAAVLLPHRTRQMAARDSPGRNFWRADRGFFKSLERGAARPERKSSNLIRCRCVYRLEACRIRPCRDAE